MTLGTPGGPQLPDSAAGGDDQQPEESRSPDVVPTPRPFHGASDLVLMAQLARRHYVAHQSKTQIAEDLGLSRFKVARLLDAAVTRGIVRFEVGLPGDIDLGLSAELRELYGLKHCVVVETPDESPETIHRYVGMTATELLADVVSDSDVLGMSTTRTLVGLTGAPTRFSKCPVVQMTGAISRLDAGDVMEAVRRFTRVGGGPAYVYYAPMLCRDVAAAQAFRAQPDFLRCRSHYKDISVAAVGIGAWSAQDSQVCQAASQRDRAICHELGARGEVCGLLINDNGEVLATPLSDRMVGVSEAELRAVPTRIAIAYGAQKHFGVRAALKSGIVNGLVADRGLAEEVLKTV